MAGDKKAILLKIDGKSIEGDGAALKKFTGKAAVVSDYQSGDVMTEAGVVEGALITDAAGLADALAGFKGFVAADLSAADVAGLENAMAAALEAADRNTLVVLASAENLYFYGLGIKRSAAVERKALAKDVVPTICYVADLPVPATATGAVLYQVLKDPNLKLNEIKKLKDGLARIEAAMHRESKDPWDKHDCA